MSRIVYENFDVTLKRKLDKHNVTLDDLSKATDIPVTTLQKYVRIGRPCVDNWRKITKYFAKLDGLDYMLEF